MANHHKPTQEELDKQIKEDLEKVESLESDEEQEDETEKENPDKKEEKKEEDDAGDDDEEEGDEEQEDEEEGEKPPDKKVEKPEEKQEKEEKKSPPDVKERYKESTREAQRLYRNNAEMNKAIEEANGLPEPTEEELATEFPEWTEMSTTEQRLSKEILINKRFREHINKASASQREIEKWSERVDKYLEDPNVFIAHRELEGKTENFKEFATRDKKLVGTDFDVLVTSFLYEQSQQKPAKKKGSLLEKGSGGSNEKPKARSSKISLAEADAIRQTNYKKYAQLVKDDMIEDDIPE